MRTHPLSDLVTKSCPMADNNNNNNNSIRQESASLFQNVASHMQPELTALINLNQYLLFT